jgi:alcohol dehydrogenase class IV
VTRPDVRYGWHAIGQTPQVVAGLGARRVLLVCGGRSFEASGAARMLPELERVAEVRRWSDFAPNPDAADLLRGLGLVDTLAPDLVLGVGGGSAMDQAKLLAGFAGITDRTKLEEVIRAGDRVTGRAPGLVLAPTTSGSGSEATHFAVVYLGDEKFSVAGDPLRPDAVILDPALSRSGSRYQRAASGIDAVAQAIESLWAAGATPASRRWARHALRLLLPAIESYVNRPDDRSARAMAVGSHLAGRAIDISRTTAAHALSYAITKRYGVSHGHAVALTLGAFIALHADAPAGRLRPGVDPAAHRLGMSEVLHRLGAADGAGARAQFGRLLDRLGLPARLSQVGVATQEARWGLVEAVNVERLGNNPVAFTPEQLAAIVGQAS